MPKKAVLSKFLWLIRRRERFWDLNRYYTSYLNINDNNFKISEISKNIEKLPTFNFFFENSDISKCSNSPNFWLRRNLDPFLEFSDHFLSDEKLRKTNFHCIWSSIFPKIFWKYWNCVTFKTSYSIFFVEAVKVQTMAYWRIIVVSLSRKSYESFSIFAKLQNSLYTFWTQIRITFVLVADP